MNILKHFELYVLNEWSVWKVNYISINLKAPCPRKPLNRLGKLGRADLPKATLTHTKLFSQRRNKRVVGKCRIRSVSQLFAVVMLCNKELWNTVIYKSKHWFFAYRSVGQLCLYLASWGLLDLCVSHSRTKAEAAAFPWGALSSQGWHKQKPSTTTQYA